MNPIVERVEDSEPSEETHTKRADTDEDEDLGRSGENIDLATVEVKSSEKKL